MAEQCIVDIAALPSKIICRSPQIDGVPQDDRRRYEIEARGPVPLIFKCAIPYLTKPLEEYGTGQGVAGLTFVRIGVGAAAQIEVLTRSEKRCVEQEWIVTCRFRRPP